MAISYIKISSKGVEMEWTITRVKLGRQHESDAPRCLGLVSEGLRALYVAGNPELVKAVRVRLPSPTFT